MPLSTVYGVATFYAHFTLRPYGRHVCEVCTGTACHIGGGEAVLAAVQDHLGTAVGTTTADGRLTVVTVRCPGLCSLAPVMVLDGAAIGRITGEERGRSAGGVVTEPRAVQVCEAASCLALGADHVRRQLRRVTPAEVQVQRVGCLGLCSAGPLVRFAPIGALAVRVGVDDVERLAAGLLEPPAVDVPARFFTLQKRVVTENFGRIDPENLDDYLAAGGYEALRTVLPTMTPDEVVDQVRRSGLRGRGGAGYPTGLKWSTVAKAAGDRKYVICNADEGDPGAFMDRAILESDPHRVLEGMAIAGLRGRARSKGYIYCRAEYPLAVSPAAHRDRPGAARRAARRPASADATFSFESRSGWAPARSSAARRPRSSPRWRAPRHTPAPPSLPRRRRAVGPPHADQQRGDVRERRRRSSATAPTGSPRIGTEKSQGTKVFALAGRVVNTGLVEVPMGMTLREIVVDIGGGIVDGRAFKAVQTGGPSGGCIPAEHLDMPVDYESLAGVGLDHGLGRHDRHGRHVLHGGRGPLLHGLLPRRSRAASASPAGSAPPSCTAARHGSPGAGDAWPTSTSWSGCAGWSAGPACAAWARRAPNPC